MKEVDAGDCWTIMPELFTVVSREVSGFISRGLCGLLKVLEVSIMFPSIIDMSLLRFTVPTLTATDNCNTELVILRLISSHRGSVTAGLQGGQTRCGSDDYQTTITQHKLKLDFPLSSLSSSELQAQLSQLSFVFSGDIRWDPSHAGTDLGLHTHTLPDSADE